MTPARIAIFVSGNGSNAESIIRYFEKHHSIHVVLLLSNNENAFALQRAARHGVETKVFDRHQFRDSDEVIAWLHAAGVTHVVLAGFLWLVPRNLISAFPQRIVNIHPSLLPKFGGKGMYGMKVHEAVHAAGETESGITIHLVNEHYDDGKILFQGRCALQKDHTPEQIAACVQQLEHEEYPRVIEKWIREETKS